MSSPTPSQHRESVPTIEEARAYLEEVFDLDGILNGPSKKNVVVPAARLRVLLASEAQLRDDLRELLEAVKPFVQQFRSYESYFSDSPDSAFAQPLSQPLGSWRVLAALYEKHNKEKAGG